MKTTSRRIFAALVGLGVPLVMVPGVRADDAADAMAEYRRQQDEANRQAYEEREARDRYLRQVQEEREAADRAYYQAQAEREARETYLRQVQQEQEAAARAYYEAQAEREARERYLREVQEQRDAQDKYYREQQAAQAQRDEWDKWQQDAQRQRDEQQKQQEWDDWMNRLWEKTHPAWPASEPEYAPQGTTRAVPQQGLVILNPFVARKKEPQNQEKERQQIMPAPQQKLPWREEFPQMIQNPYVRSSR